MEARLLPGRLCLPISGNSAEPRRAQGSAREFRDGAGGATLFTHRGEAFLPGALRQPAGAERNGHRAAQEDGPHPFVRNPDFVLSARPRGETSDHGTFVSTTESPAHPRRRALRSDIAPMSERLVTRRDVIAARASAAGLTRGSR